jgi:hypothetical protein
MNMNIPVLDLSRLAANPTILDVFLDMARQFMKAEPAVMALFQVQWAVGSAECRIWVACDCMVYESPPIVFTVPANTAFDVEKHTGSLWSAAAGWVSSLRPMFNRMAVAPGTTYCGLRFKKIPHKEIDEWLKKAFAIAQARNSQP